MSNGPTAEELVDGLLRVKQAVATFGVSRTDLYDAMKRGDLRYFMKGQHRLIPKTAIVEWLRATLKPAA